MATEQGRASPEVSVIVPFYNREEYIERCLQGLLAQTYPPGSYELLLVDNNSSDRSCEIVRNYPRVRLLHEEKQGAYAARNHGVAASRGQILVFTDADCVPSPDWLKELATQFSAPTVGLAQGRRVFGADGSMLSMLAAYEAETHAYIFSGEVKGAVFGYTNNMAVRREVFDRCGPFLETARGADSIFVDRVVRRFSHQVLRYSREASVRHLELTTVRKWLWKKALYGRSLQKHRQERPSHRNLTAAETFAIFRNTVRQEGYSVVQAALLFALISIGNLSFKYGRLRSGRSRTDR
jgi:glycosyltransferase involved in cell wall biosynthesis